MISFLVLYLTWFWGSYPEANSSSQVRQSVALNHPKNIHFVASSTSTLTSLFGFAFHKKGQNFHPIDFGDSLLFTQSRRRRRWEIYSHTRSPNISAASVGCGKNMKHYTLLFFFRGATKSPPAGRNFRCVGCNFLWGNNSGRRWCTWWQFRSQEAITGLLHTWLEKYTNTHGSTQPPPTQCQQPGKTNHRKISTREAAHNLEGKHQQRSPPFPRFKQKSSKNSKATMNHAPA